MNELEALQILRAKGVIDTRYCKKIELDKCLDVIEKALLELKAIKEANPSEALECLDYIENKLKGLKYECERTNNHRCDDLFIPTYNFDTIKQALIQAEKDKKKARAVDYLLKHFNFTFYERTRQVCIQSKRDKGTYETTASADLEKHKADFELLSEVLEND